MASYLIRPARAGRRHRANTLTTEGTEDHGGKTGALPSCLCGSLWLLWLKGVDISFTLPKHHNKLGNTNYQRNLMGLTGVPRMGLVWVTKLFSSVPMKRPLAR